MGRLGASISHKSCLLIVVRLKTTCPTDPVASHHSSHHLPLQQACSSSLQNQTYWSHRLSHGEQSIIQWGPSERTQIRPNMGGDGKATQLTPLSSLIPGRAMWLAKVSVTVQFCFFLFFFKVSSWTTSGPPKILLWSFLQSDVKDLCILCVFTNRNHQLMWAGSDFSSDSELWTVQTICILYLLKP